MFVGVFDPLLVPPTTMVVQVQYLRLASRVGE